MSWDASVGEVLVSCTTQLLASLAVVQGLLKDLLTELVAQGKKK